MILTVIKRISSSLILAVIILFNIVNTFIWLKIDKSYLKLDAWGHYRYSLEVFEFLKGIFHNIPLGSIEPMKWHGFLVGFTSAPFYFIFGSAQDTAIMINSAIFFTILILATYGIAKKLLNKQAGILAAFILSAYPIIFNNLRIYMLDLPLTSMVALSLYFLVICEDFNSRKKSLLFGLSFGMGLLVKFNYIAFIIGPLVFILYQVFKESPTLSNVKLKNIIYLTIVAACLFVAFYILRSRDMFNRIYEISNFGLFQIYRPAFSEFLTWRILWLLKYLELFIRQGLSFLFFIVLLIGFMIFNIKITPKDKWLLYLVVIVPLFAQIFLFLIPAECMLRYNMPFLPALAIISSAGLSSIKNKIFKIFFLSVIILAGMIQFFAISYGIPLLPKKIEFSAIKRPYDFNLTLFQQNIGVPPFLNDKSSHPSSADWKSTQVLDAIIKSNVSKERVKVLSLSNIPEIFEAMEYQVLKKRWLIDLMPATSIMMERFYEKRHAPLDMLCITSDYIIISNNTDSVWEMVFSSDSAWKEKIENARKTFYENIGRFKLIETFNLPDGSNLFIYKNIYKSELIKYQGIQQADIKLLFDNGRLRIFYKGSEITKGLGLYVSLFALQHWRDSMEATWQVQKISDTKLTAKGRWMFIPITQAWEIELKEGKFIDWHVRMEAKDMIKIEIENFKLMLSDNYKSWFVSSGEKGAFPDTFEESLWKKSWTGNIKNHIGVNAVKTGFISLPKVIFYGFECSPEYTASIENSDQLFNGRVIGVFKKNEPPKNNFNPGQYKYFSAKILIE